MEGSYYTELISHARVTHRVLRCGGLALPERFEACTRAMRHDASASAIFAIAGTALFVWSPSVHYNVRMPCRVLVIPGSLRADSFARRLARAAADLARAQGAGATVAELRDLPMPLYDGDLEAAQGLPANAVALRRLVQQHDALLVVTPEYNASIPAVLKNALDWVSRPYAPEPNVQAFRGKTTAMLASSPGALGGLRALVHLRQIMMNLGMLVLTEQYALGGADAAFGPGGELVDDRQRNAVGAVISRLVAVATKLAN